MKYVHLKFKNCGLICDVNSKHIEYDYDNFGSINVAAKSCHDLTNPIPATLFSNVLHVLCGQIPVSTKKKNTRGMKRIPVLDDIAFNHSYIKFYNGIIYDKFGNILNAEIFKTNKAFYNSAAKSKQKFKLYDGSSLIVKNGNYNWNYCKRYFSEVDGAFEYLVSFLNSILNCDVLNIPFSNMITKLSEYWNTESFNEKVDVFLKEWKQKYNQKTFSKPWQDVLFFNRYDKHKDKVIESNNCTYNTNIPLFTESGICKKVALDGEIICMIDEDCKIKDRRVIDLIYENSGLARLLEDGMIYISNISEYEPVINFEMTFDKIF